MNMTKVMWCRFQQCLSTFTILLVEASSETGLYKHLSDYNFGVRNFENTKAMMVIFGFKTSEISARLQKSSKKKGKKIFGSDLIASELLSLICLY